MYRRVEPIPHEDARQASEHSFSIYMNLIPLDNLPHAARTLYGMFGFAMGLLHIPKEKMINRPKVDSLLDAAEAAVRATEIFHNVLGPIQLDVVRLRFLIPTIKIGREMLRSAGNFYDLLYANLSFWENEVEAMLRSFDEKAAPFTKDNQDMLDVLEDVHEHIHGSAERGAETAAKNRDLRKEAREAGIKEGEARARDQAQKDADKVLIDAIGKLRNKLGDGSDKDK